MSLKFNTIIISNRLPKTHRMSQIPATPPPPRLTPNGGKQRRLGLVGMCAAERPESPVIMTHEEEEELMKVRRPEKCKDKGDTAELLECLEKEAIMGEDEGRDPKDYDRRAMIFDKSSRMFQALKEQRNYYRSRGDQR